MLLVKDGRCITTSLAPFAPLHHVWDLKLDFGAT